MRRVGALRGHQAGVVALAFSPDGKLLATASMDRTARLWDWKSEREVATLGGHDDFVYDVAFSAGGERIVTISASGTAKVWDLPAVLRRNLLLTNSWWLRMTADERSIASAIADNQGMIHIWDRLNRTRTHTLQSGSQGLFGLAFSSDGQQLAWASRTTLGILDLQSGRTNTISLEGNRGMFVGIAFSPNNQEIIFGCATNAMLCDLLYATL